MLFVNVAGAALIGLIVWWFWLYKPKAVVMEESGLLIVVEDGTYHPARIKLIPNRATQLNFLRKDASPCAEMVLFPALDISESLPLNKSRTIQLPPLAEGEYEFHCQMQMYRGVLTVG
jgi:plastocyanin domain-containing protein